MAYPGITAMLTAARRLLYLQRLLEGVALGLLIAACVVTAAALLHVYHSAVPPGVWVSAALLPPAAAAVAAMIRPLTNESAARAADRWLDTHQLFSAAWYLISGDRKESPSAAAGIVLQQAEQAAASRRGDLPRPRNPCRPLPTSIGVAVAATSLFVLSLQGAEPDDSGPALGRETVRSPVISDEERWLSKLNDELSGDAEPRQALPSGHPPSRASFEPDGEPGSEISLAGQVDPGTHSEAGTSTVNRSTVTGSGAGRAASMEEARSSSGRAVHGESGVSTDFATVGVQRKNTEKTSDIDRDADVEMIPFAIESDRRVLTDSGPPVAAAPVKPLAPDVGPAHRAFQARYLEETSGGE